MAACPPSPTAALPIIQGALDRLAGESTGNFLGLAPPAAVNEWARVAELAASGSEVRVAGTTSASRLGSIMGSGNRYLVFTSPETALEMVRRAEFDVATVTGYLVLNPEQWGGGGEELLTSLFQDVSRETQRVFLTADPERVAPLIERYGWRAPVHDAIAGSGPPVASVRVTPVAWSGRIEALKDLVDQLGLNSLRIWTAAPVDDGAIRRALAAAGVSGTIGLATPETGALTVAYDLPSPATLNDLAAGGEVLLLVPPGTEGYVARLAVGRIPVPLRGELEHSRVRAARTRARILAALESRLDAELALLAPVFERSEATLVAAALLQLWQQAESRGAVASPSSAGGPPVRLWVSAGRRDEIAPGDLVGVLVRECEVPREAIGRVEIRESYSLVELGPEAGPEAVAERLTGKTIRKRRLVARLDRPSAPVKRVSKRFSGPKDRRGA